MRRSTVPAINLEAHARNRELIATGPTPTLATASV